MQELYSQTGSSLKGLEINKILRNTYILLSATLAFSAVTCGISMAVGMGRGTALIMSLAALALVWFVLPRTANSEKGLLVVFAFTGLLGASLGPTLNHYLSLSNGSQIVMQALGGTALVFFGLSGYVLTTKKDFSFMRGFLVTGIIVVSLAMLGTVIAGLLGVQISGISLAISAAVVLLMSGFILYDTSRIVTGGETNYIMATVALYLSIYNLFTALLHIFGAFNDD